MKEPLNIKIVPVSAEQRRIAAGLAKERFKPGDHDRPLERLADCEGWWLGAIRVRQQFRDEDLQRVRDMEALPTLAALPGGKIEDSDNVYALGLTAPTMRRDIAFGARAAIDRLKSWATDHDRAIRDYTARLAKAVKR